MEDVTELPYLTPIYNWISSYCYYLGKTEHSWPACIGSLGHSSSHISSSHCFIISSSISSFSILKILPWKHRAILVGMYQVVGTLFFFASYRLIIISSFYLGKTEHSWSACMGSLAHSSPHIGKLQEGQQNSPETGLVTPSGVSKELVCRNDRIVADRTQYLLKRSIALQLDFLLSCFKIHSVSSRYPINAFLTWDKWGSTGWCCVLVQLQQGGLTSPNQYIEIWYISTCLLAWGVCYAVWQLDMIKDIGIFLL